MAQWLSTCLIYVKFRVHCHSSTISISGSTSWRENQTLQEAHSMSTENNVFEKILYCITNHIPMTFQTAKFKETILIV